MGGVEVLGHVGVGVADGLHQLPHVGLHGRLVLEVGEERLFTTSGDNDGTAMPSLVTIEVQWI